MVLTGCRVSPRLVELGRELAYSADVMRSTFSKICLFVLCFASLPLVGCQYDPWAGGFLTGQSSEKDIAGTYRIHSEARLPPLVCAL